MTQPDDGGTIHAAPQQDVRRASRTAAPCRRFYRVSSDSHNKPGFFMRHRFVAQPMERIARARIATSQAGHGL